MARDGLRKQAECTGEWGVGSDRQMDTGTEQGWQGEAQRQRDGGGQSPRTGGRPLALLVALGLIPSTSSDPLFTQEFLSTSRNNS